VFKGKSIETRRGGGGGGTGGEQGTGLWGGAQKEYRRKFWGVPRGKEEGTLGGEGKMGGGCTYLLRREKQVPRLAGRATNREFEGCVGRKEKRKRKNGGQPARLERNGLWFSEHR